MFVVNGLTSFLTFALIILAIVRVIYLLMIKNRKYFIQQNIRFENGYPTLATMYLSILGKILAPSTKSLQNIYQKHSRNRKFIGINQIGGRPLLMIMDPDLICDITIKNFDCFVDHIFQFDKDLDPLVGHSLFNMSGQQWQKMRNTLSGLFTGNKLRRMLPLMNNCITDLNAYIRTEIGKKPKADGLEFNMNDLMLRFETDVITKFAFGIQCNALHESENKLYKIAKEISYAPLGIRSYVMVAFPKIAAWLRMNVFNDPFVKCLRSMIDHTIEEREKKSIVGHDLLNLLLLAKQSKSNEPEKENNNNQYDGSTAKTMEKLKDWTDDDMLAQCIFFYSAAVAGVSKLLAFLCYELSFNQEIQQRLYEEIIETKDQLKENPVTFEALQKMKYMDMVVSEVSRKWPIGTEIDRSVTKKFLLEDYDGSKVLLQPNDHIYISMYNIHRDPKFYPNPEQYNPERFSDENKMNIQRGTYFPFGMGPRTCIASRFTILQLKMVIFHILLDFKIETSPKTPTLHEFNDWISDALNSVGGIFNHLTLRN